MFAYTYQVYCIINPTTIQVAAIPYQGVPAILLYPYDSQRQYLEPCCTYEHNLYPIPTNADVPTDKRTTTNRGPSLPLLAERSRYGAVEYQPIRWFELRG